MHELPRPLTPFTPVLLDMSVANSPLTFHAEIYSASPSHRRECTYYIAVGYYKLRNYAYAKKFNGEYNSSQFTFV